MDKYEPVIGLEVHVELNTKSKMFCSCSADYFGKKPNTHTCPVCLGLPGALPYINEKAIESCIKIGLALNCKVAEDSLFERKNYFYPDLSKGYQISQYRWPLTVKGWLEVENDKGEKVKIRINRAHQEEDTGKLTHQGNETLIDFNRSGVPLVEIVTEPDFTDSSQIRDYAKKLQQIVRYLGVSNADMEKGDMRLEANISVRKLEIRNPKSETGEKKLPPYRVELKNINSFRFMVAAVEYEIKRQIQLYEEGRDDELRQETRGWDQDKKETYLQRSKEEANDYRYFPEPDLPELKIQNEEFRMQNLPELPQAKEKRFIEEFGLSKNNARILVEEAVFADLFEAAVTKAKERGLEPNKLANYIVNQKVDLINDGIDQIIENVLANGANLIVDEDEIEGIAKEVINENPKLVEAYKNGKATVIHALIGAGMKKGKLDVSRFRLILLEKLA